MADPTALINHTFKTTPNREISQAIIKTSEALMIGGHAAISRSTGLMEFAGDAADLIPCGVVTGESLGNSSHLTGDGTYEAIAQGGVVVRVSVTGASAITDVSKFVYMTDGQTYNLTRPADDAVPYGIVLKWDTSTYCFVYVFGLIEAILASMLSVKETLLLGVFPSNALQGTAAAELLTDIPQYGHFTIDDIYAVCVAHDNAAVAGSQVLEIDIGATSVKTTGGVNPAQLTLAYTDCDAVGDMGAIIAASAAIVTANEVHDGDTVSVRMNASGTGFTADCAAAFALYATITRLPGA